MASEQRAEVLGVYLEPTAARSVRVGSLLKDAAGAVTFIVDDGYIERGPDRPILSLAFHSMAGEEETIARLRQRRDKIGRVTTLPAVFSNLLPEGALRSMVEVQLPPGDAHEFGMLRRLGEDLPGAVVVRDEGTATPVAAKRRASQEPTRSIEDAALVKFSLAGVQMKFSMIEAGERLTVPGRGKTGRVIVKLPSADYPDLPEIEYGAMRLAEAAGVTTAAVRLFPAGSLENVRPELLHHGKNVLVVSRFDRRDEGRVHIEDFAQILGAVGNRKYNMANVETMVRLVSRFTPDPAASVLEMVRRITVDIMLGNGDSHLKNTSFIYPDGKTPLVSPAYDIVPTVFFQPGDRLALTFGGKRSFERIGPHAFERMAGYVDVNARAILREVASTIERANDRWPALLRELPWPKSVKRTLEARWGHLALLTGKSNPFAP